MCGLAGVWEPAGADRRDIRAKASRMAEALAHRGPDAAGVWADGGAGIGLGHRRLSILDLSPKGNQPMVSHCGRYVVAYNGEVFNFQELRRDLVRLGHPFRGGSDTEVILAGIAEWGLEKGIKRCVGMFAFALWDRAERILYLVRDRVGIKPLYFGWAGKTFLFGSELKAFHACPGFTGDVDPAALALYLRHGYVPAPLAIYRRTYKLLPGCILRVDAELAAGLTSFSPHADDGDAGCCPFRYWSLREVAGQGSERPFMGTETDAIDSLAELLRDAVRLRMVADVPIGAFLSGGVDSSCVVALMQSQSGRPVNTFTIGFREGDFDEARYARAVALHLGTDHTELYVTPAQALDVVPRLAELYDEPFGDASQIPTFLISRLARSYVKVSLSGDGGDEVFGGYTRYLMCKTIWERVGWLPIAVRRFMRQCLEALTPGQWDTVFRALRAVLPGRLRVWLPGDKMYKLAEVLAAGSPDHMYQLLVSHWKRPQTIMESGGVWFEQPGSPTRAPHLANVTDRMMYMDLMTHLPDDMLAKVDRASMGVSLEARVPLLDHRVVEFAWRIPHWMKIKNGESKWLLRQILYQYVPKELVDRPKRGFGVPLGAWLRGPLREWAENLLARERLAAAGFLRAEPIRARWAEHLSGRRDWEYCLWVVLMFQSWRERWG